MSDLVRVRLNGEERVLPAGTTVAAVVADAGLTAVPHAVEINHEVAPRATHATRTLADGDAVEIVAFVGGG